MTQATEARRTPMSVVDTAWLRMDAADNLMIVNGIMEFESGLPREQLLALLQGRLLEKGPRFACKPVKDGAGYAWVPVGSLDWDYHLTRAALPPGGDPDRALADFVNQVSPLPLDPAHPLWRFYLIDDFKGGSAVLVRVHHCYADGIALISLLDAIADESVLHSSPAARIAIPGVEKTGEGPLALLSYLVRWCLFRGAFALAWLFEALRVSLMPADRNGAYKQALSSRKQVAWAASRPVEEVKRVGKALNATVNDVLVACAAGALRRHLESMGQPVDGVSVRVTIPVNLRPLSEALQLGNKFGLVYLALPVDVADPVERVRLVRRNMQSLKGGAQAVMSYGVLGILGYFPTAIQRIALNFFSSKASAVMTNVPGPADSLRILGTQVRRSMFWVPQSGGIGVGLSILSYHQKVEFGIVADSALISDPHEIVRYFDEEFHKLQTIAGSV